ncbi:MAG: hypothetical protein ACFFC7_09585 [Candidatus Hermodarchaeota archaeon]
MYLDHRKNALIEVEACFGFSWWGFLIGALCSSISVIIVGVLIHKFFHKNLGILDYLILYGALIILIFVGAMCGGVLSSYTGEYGPKIGIFGSIISGISGIAGSITAGLTGDLIEAIIDALLILAGIGVILLLLFYVLFNVYSDGTGDFEIIIGSLIAFGIGFPGASIGTIASYAIGSHLGFSLDAAIVGGLIGGISSLIIGFLCNGGIGAYFSSRECLKRCQRTLPNLIAQHGTLDLEYLNGVEGRLAKFVLSFFPTKRERIISLVKSGKFPPSLQLRENETKLVDVSN